MVLVLTLIPHNTLEFLASQSFQSTGKSTKGQIEVANVVASVVTRCDRWEISLGAH